MGTYILAMERVLALTLWVLISLGVVSVELLTKAGSLDLKSDWHQYIAAHMTPWLMLVPIFYAAVCEVVRAVDSPAALLKIMRGIGFLLLAVFTFLFAYIIFDF